MPCNIHELYFYIYSNECYDALLNISLFWDMWFYHLSNDILYIRGWSMPTLHLSGSWDRIKNLLSLVPKGAKSKMGHPMTGWKIRKCFNCHFFMVVSTALVFCKNICQHAIIFNMHHKKLPQHSNVVMVTIFWPVMELILNSILSHF